MKVMHILRSYHYERNGLSNGHVIATFREAGVVDFKMTFGTCIEHAR